jgi:hypothetical protein
MATKQQISDAVENALKRLVKEDEYLLIHDVNERSLSHRLAMYLQAEVDTWDEGWHVDCEYNRDIDSGEYYSKKLNFTEKDLIALRPGFEDEHASTVFPDVILHRRGKTVKEGGNLLVIEAKKSSSGDKWEFDKSKKLPEYCHQLGYQYAAFVLLKTHGKADYTVEWIRSPAG